jgi:hypothetical protein
MERRDSCGTPLIVRFPHLVALLLSLLRKCLPRKFSSIRAGRHRGRDTRRVEWVRETNAVADRDPTRTGDHLSLIGELLADGLRGNRVNFVWRVATKEHTQVEPGPY